MSDNDQRPTDRPLLASDEHHPAVNHTGSSDDQSDDSGQPKVKRPHLRHAHRNPHDTPSDNQHSEGHRGGSADKKHQADEDPAAQQSAAIEQGRPIQFGSGPAAPEPEIATPSEPTTDQSPPKTIFDSKHAGIIGAVVLAVCLVGSGVWFHLNRHVYTLGRQDPVVAHQQPSPTTAPETLGAKAGQKTLSLALNLKPLTQGHYQAWLAQGENITSLGGFAAGSAGPIQNLDGTPFSPVVGLNQNQPASILITIEAGPDLATSPSNTVVLTGDLVDGRATLAFTALNLDNATGVYTLATPTNGPDSDETSGLWFAKANGSELTGPGLNFPEAPVGWKYEAQLVYNNVVVGMGRFSRPDQVDEFNKFSTNPEAAPSFPGEDFLHKPLPQLGLEFPTDLASGSWRIVISIEPDVNGTDPTGEEMFYIQPFSANIAAGSESFKEYQLIFDPTMLPTGSAELK